MTAPQTYEQMTEPAGDMTDELLLEQLPQVKYIARRIHERLPQHVPFDDLVHAGIVGLIDAVRLATEIFRRPITNTLMLGAFARTTGIVSLDSLKQTLLESEFRDAGLDQNLAALDRGYNEAQVHRLGSKVAA